MTAALQKEAREAAEVMIDAMFPGPTRWNGTSPEYHRKGYIKGYLAAATARERENKLLLDSIGVREAMMCELEAEIASLRTQLAELEGKVTG